MSKISINLGIYRHYKGNLYEVLGVARHSDTHEPMVVYQALYDSKEFGTNALWVRPISAFLETVLVDEEERPRFQFVSQVPVSSTFQH